MRRGGRPEAMPATVSDTSSVMQRGTPARCSEISIFTLAGPGAAIAPISPLRRHILSPGPCSDASRFVYGLTRRHMHCHVALI
jgi:hypothetical protein